MLVVLIVLGVAGAVGLVGAPAGAAPLTPAGRATAVDGGRDEVAMQVAEPTVTAVDVELTLASAGDRDDRGNPVPRGRARLRGRASYTLARPARGGESLVLLDFAAHLATVPTELDEIAVDGVADGPWTGSVTEVEHVEGAAHVRRGAPPPVRAGSRPAAGPLVIELAPGVDRVVLTYRVDVPSRDWPFGCSGRRCSLTGGLAPLPSAPAQGGRWLPPGRVLAPARWRVEVVTRSAARGDVRVVDGRGAAAASPPAIAYPTVVVAPRWRETVAILRGVTVEVLDTRPRPSAHAPDEPALALRRDVPGRVLRIVEELLTLLAELGAPVAVDERIVVIIGPLRSDVAQAHPHAVYVSDQALDLLPTERLLRFHEVAIARALLDDLLTRALAPHLSPSARTWVPGTVAFALTEVWERRRDYRDEFAGDILRNFTFVPAIDRFLYTGQAAFGSQYFRGVEDVDPLRNHPERFHHELPRGRRIHAKLLDTLGPTRVAELYASWLRAPEQPFEAAAEAAYGHVLDWFFDQWIGPYPAVDYGIKQVASARAGAGWAHEITLEKRGLRPLVEPVQVLVKERGGREHRLVWNGELGPDAGRGAGLAAEPLAGVHVLRLQTDRPLRSVRLDPRARLQQTAFAPPNVDPRFDDRRPAAFRFLYTGAGLSIAASEIANATTASAAANAIAGFVSFEASLRRDLRRTGHFILLRNRESNLSGSAGVNFRFGAKANELRRRARVRLFGTIDWLSDRSLDTEGGVRLIQSLALIDDTRRSVWWPARGHQLWLEAAARQTLRGGEDPLSVDLLVDASYVQQVPIVHGHTLATLLDVRAVLPLRGPLEFRALQRAGGIGALSGYGADELFGRGVARVQAEYRHTFVDDLPVNALNLAWLRSLGGALFAGTASVSGCESFAGWLGPETWYGAVGYGLTANLQILGVTPQLVRVEVAVPLVRRTTQCLDRTLPDWLAQLQGLDDAAALLPPYNISLLFTQPF